MSTFELAIPVVLRREGGYVNDPKDPGGATNFGISLRWLKQAGLLAELELEEGDVTHDEIMAVKIMSQSIAENFYRTKWWNPPQYSLIVAQAVATKVFDTAVNVGPQRAHKFLQQAIDVPQDGVLGPMTLAKTNATNSILLLHSYQEEQAQFYRNLVLLNPDRQKFLAGWLRRAYDLS